MARPDPPNGKTRPAPARSKARGWLLIAAVALAIALLVVLGTMDPELRYSLIGV